MDLGMFSQLEMNRTTAKIIYVYMLHRQMPRIWGDVWGGERQGVKCRMACVCVHVGMHVYSSDVAIDVQRADVDAFQLNKSYQIN